MVVTAGDTLSVVPVPASVPPHDPVYHVHAAAVPSDPPETDNVVLFPGQITGALAEADAGAVELELTVTVTLAQAVVLQVPSALR